MTPADLLKRITARLEMGKRIRQTLPGGGFLQLDRPVPFLCVYRRPQRPTEGMEKLLKGTAAYLILSTAHEHRCFANSLLKSIRNDAERRFGGFLLLEIWSSGVDEKNELPLLDRPTFDVFMPHQRDASVLVEAFKAGISRLRVQRKRPLVNVGVGKTTPPKLHSFFGRQRLRQPSMQLGIRILPLFANRESETTFPAVLRAFHRAFTRALQRVFFAYYDLIPSPQPVSHLALGPRFLSRTARDVDQRLSGLNARFDFLLEITPVNLQSSWNRFKRNHYSRIPGFIYRPLHIDSAELKRELYHIDFSEIADPSILNMFREKRTELDRQFSMLRDRNTSAFVHGSKQLYGPVGDDLRQLAHKICELVSPRARDASGSRLLNAKALAAAAEEELGRYRVQAPDLSSRVHIREDVSGVLVSHGNLLIGKKTVMASHRLDAVLQHELGTHVLTHYNGQRQPLQLMQHGLANYEELQEGTAVLMEFLSGGLSRPRMRVLAARVLAADAMMRGADFMETFRILVDDYRFQKRQAFFVAARVHRGGGLSKDIIYLRGFCSVLEYLAGGGDLEQLLVGKIAKNHNGLVNELLHRRVLHPPKLLPACLARAEAQERLEVIRRGVTALDIVKRRF